jgi:hypothetical protein
MPSRITFVRWIAILAGMILFLYIGTILPRMHTGLFTSPDETAVSLFANVWTPENGFRLPVELNGPAKDIVQLHPRSMVRQGDWIVPVGFLGMPFFVMFLERLGDGYGQYLTCLLIVSSASPFFFLLRKSAGAFTAYASVAIFLCFPTVLLYANRGLFPNLAVLAFAIWATWALRLFSEISSDDQRRREQQLLIWIGGVAIGSALLIRPIEAIWMLPWIGWALWPFFRSSGRVSSRFFKLIPLWICLGCVSILGLWLSMKTYPFHHSLFTQPISGYQLSDYIPQPVSERSAEGITRDVRTLIPFSLHPRTLWNNIRFFGMRLFGIWIGVGIAGAFIAARRFRKEALPVFLISAWTFFSLFLLYGQTLYFDNINGTPTLGNSFLRYLLPLVPLIAFGCALAADWLRRQHPRGVILSTIVVLFLSLYGLGYAMSGDDESILATRRELARYAQIREMTESTVPTNAVILSERSDKIFTSHTTWTSVSPLPDEQRLIALRNADVPIYLFHRIVETEEDLPASFSHVFTVALPPLFTMDNEALYAVYGLPSISP